MNDNPIRVSFMNTEDEQKLLSNILEESKFIGKAKWMKIAAREKLQRDRDKFINNNRCNAVKTNSQSQVVNTLDELFKQ